MGILYMTGILKETKPQTPTPDKTMDFAVFPDSTMLSNVSNRACSYYTAKGKNSDVLLSNINYSNVLTNIEDGLVNLKSYMPYVDGTDTTKSFTNLSIKPDLTEYINNMNKDILQLGFIANCLTEALGATALGATEQVFAAKKELETSKDRYEELQSPETHVSYYEGTFPIYRPIKDSTLFGLFAAGLFLMLLSLICFLRTQGVEINLILPQTTLPGIPTNMFAGMGTYIGIASVLGIITGYFIHIYYKQ